MNNYYLVQCFNQVRPPRLAKTFAMQFLSPPFISIWWFGAQECACGRDAALLAVTIFMKLRGATAASSAFSSGERCMGGLNLHSFSELSHGSFSRSQRWPPAHLSSACGPPWCSCECSLYHSVYIGDAPPLATPSPQKKGAQTKTSALNGHQNQTL